jgi:hypothetical protein
VIPAGVRIFVRAEAVDMRRGFDRLAQTARDVCGLDPQQGVLETHRGRSVIPLTLDDFRQAVMLLCMCPVCEGCSFRWTTWESHNGARWPALECRDCGAITREKHVDSRSLRPTPLGIEQGLTALSSTPDGRTANLVGMARPASSTLPCPATRPIA